MRQLKFYSVTKSIFTNLFPKRKLHHILLEAEKLKNKLEWVPTCENGIDNIVPFFQITTVFEDLFFEILADIEDIHVLSKKEEKFILELRSFLVRVGRSENGWNRTREGRTPSRWTIIINVDKPYSEMIAPQKVAHYMVAERFPIKEEEITGKNAHRRTSSTKDVDEFILYFMNENYNLLKKTIDEFK